MIIQKAAYLLYLGVRRVVRAAGLTKALRGPLGPLAGRLILRLGLRPNGCFSVHGHQMLLASGNAYPPLDMATGRYEKETTRLFLGLVKPGMVVLDVGAHLGYYTLLAARQVGPTGRVYAFEPDPDNHALLVRNIQLNGYANVTVARKAVSDQVGCATLYLTALDSGRHSIYRHGLPVRGSVEVDTTTVDAYLGSEGWPNVGLVKIDVEGAEVPVLKGMAGLLKRSAEVNLIIEFNPSLLQQATVTPLQFLEKPAALGFKIDLIDERKGLCPLESCDAPVIVDRLLVSGGSVNLLCTPR